MKRFWPLFAALPLLAGFGIAEGVWTNRWGLSAAVEEAAARLARVPSTVGDWEGEDQELDARQVARAELAGHVMRRYTHRRTGASVSILLVCGRPGPVAVHSPEVCYAGTGYELVAPPKRQAVRTDSADAPAEFWAGNFRKGGAIPEPLRLYWSWTARGDWTAADHPRLHFAGAPALYKLYVIRRPTGLEEPAGEDPTLEFLRAFLPQVREALFER